jgi:hypothetical protein
MRVLTMLTCWACIATAHAQLPVDPYQYLERMYEKLATSNRHHAKVRVTMRGTTQKSPICSDDVFESYRDGDNVLVLKPSSVMMSTSGCFIVVDKGSRTIMLQEHHAGQKSEEGMADPLGNLDKLRKEWKKAKVLQEDASRITYRCTSENVSIMSAELTLDKRSCLLTHVRYAMQNDHSDTDCSVIDLDYQVLDLEAEMPKAIFDRTRFVRRTSGGRWAPSNEYKGYEVRKPNG